MATAKGVEITRLDTTPRTLLEKGSVGTVKVFMDTIEIAMLRHQQLFNRL
jgi:hypothetical protein